ncbi:hypothetical protein TB2_033699 [Malus domestica]
MDETHEHTNNFLVNLDRKPDHPIVNSGTCLARFLIAECLPPWSTNVGLIKRFWASYGDFKVSARMDTTFIITAPLESAANRVLDDMPWNIAGDHFAIHREVIVVDDPFACLYGIHDFLQVRLKVDARKPFSNGFWLQRIYGGRTRVMFKYECLSNFFFHCGKLGHFDKYYEHEVPNVNNDYPYSTTMVEEQVRPPRLTHTTSRANNYVSKGGKCWNSTPKKRQGLPWVLETPIPKSPPGGASAIVRSTRTNRAIFLGWTLSVSQSVSN